MMAAVKVVDYEEWSRRKQSASATLAPKVESGGVLARKAKDRVLVDASEKRPGLPFVPPRPPVPVHPSEVGDEGADGDEE
ncbi:MAG: hypothetical protein KGJ23_00380 [Euryarchaeota archaeon]|nr:hypothetical protein [Euryarchaeota archaeon]MDE1835052.1 hypothetical protein [Euryarchaeota archaeon]MDE1879323.1 hypothetical protein [Euryarchaeota archaeon]MDE2044891.1 hypothetical protein [Thermoplasmata archaeon]